MKMQQHHFGALRRAIESLQREQDELMRSEDPYDAMFPEGDAKALREVVDALKVKTNVALAGPDGWHPIDTAPKDGSVILVTGLDFGVGPSRFYLEAEWMDGNFYDVNDRECDLIASSYLTHWVPLPAPSASIATSPSTGERE